MKNDINLVVNLAINFDNFLDRMKNLGYEIVNDKNGIGFKNDEQKYYTRLKSLGELYSIENIDKIIENNSLKNKLTKTPVRENTVKINSVEELLEPKNITWRRKLKYCIDYILYLILLVLMIS